MTYEDLFQGCGLVAALLVAVTLGLFAQALFNLPPAIAYPHGCLVNQTENGSFVACTPNFGNVTVYSNGNAVSTFSPALYPIFFVAGTSSNAVTITDEDESPVAVSEVSGPVYGAVASADDDSVVDSSGGSDTGADDAGAVDDGGGTAADGGGD